MVPGGAWHEAVTPTESGDEKVGRSPGAAGRPENAAQAAHPAYRQSLERPAGMGVLLGSYEPHRPKAGGGADHFRWTEALDLLEPEPAGRRHIRT